MTTIGNLPIGARIRENKSGTIFIVADHKHMGWKGTTLYAEKVCLISCIDACEAENPDEKIAVSGNNRYALSNINQWLNSSEEKWFSASHEFDSPPEEELISSRQDIFESKFFDHDTAFRAPYSYSSMPGYLCRFSKGFVDALIENPVPCFGLFDPDIIHYGPPSAEEVPCRVFLPSAAEFGLEDEVRWEGYLIRLFQDARMRMTAPENEAIHKDSGYDYKHSAAALWLRSPLGGTTHMGKIFQAEHKFGDVVGASLMPHPVNYAAGIRPLLNIRDDIETVSRDEYGIYSINI